MMSGAYALARDRDRARESGTVPNRTDSQPKDVQNGQLPDGSPVYSFEKVQTGVGKDYSVSYETMCTRALILTSSSKLSEPSRRQLGHFLLKSSKLIPPSR
jgi:hypothetical protein